MNTSKLKIVLTISSMLLATLAQAGSTLQQGINSLNGQNITAANTDFASAVTADPTDPDANLYYAMTQLLVLPSLTSGNNFLTQIGVGSSGRDVFHWTAGLPHTKTGKIEIPNGLNADVFAAQLRNNIVTALIAAQNNLAQITSPGFTLNVSEYLTNFPDVTIDYGDVLMLRAIANTAEVYGYSLYSLNMDASITSVSNIIKTDKSLEDALTAFPNAFTFNTTADLAASKTAFSNAATLYFKALDFINNSRAPGPNYLFNLDAKEIPKEAKFRQTLTNLLLSLNGPAQPITPTSPYKISMAAFFSGKTTLRSLLPQFPAQGAGFIWDTFPDPTLGGVVQGLTQTNLDEVFVNLKLGAQLETPGITLKVISQLTGDEGDQPNGVIRGTDGNLYGTVEYGGTNYQGAVFKVTPSGAFTTLYLFGSNPNVDLNAASPNALIQGRDGFLYGTAQYGGANNSGTLFRISTTGVLKTLYNFGASEDGSTSTPYAALVQGADGNLYGTTFGGYNYQGNAGYGTIFSFSPTSGKLVNLYSFSGTDGGYPASALIQGKDGNLYGATTFGGTNYDGTLFEISTDGSAFYNLYNFGSVWDTNGNPLDGFSPNGLVQGKDGSFYGTTQQGGTNYNYGDMVSDGTAFRLTVSGGVGTLSTLFDFGQQNLGGYFPIGALVQGADGRFYGVAADGGANNQGSIFAFAPAGAATSVFWFVKDGGGGGFGYGDGYGFLALTLGADGNFYGATENNSSVYELSVSGSSAPVIGTEPASSQTAQAGGSVMLQVAAAGSGTLTYQWYFNGNKVSGATSATLTLKSVTAASAGSYDVVIKDSAGSVTSSTETLTVVVPPQITTQPANESTSIGGNVAFSVKATGSALVYQWWFTGQGQSAASPLSDSGNISGSATSSLKISGVTSAEAGSYAVVVGTSPASVESKTAVLKLVVETTKPSVVITSPKAASRTNNPVLSGTATDTIAVAGVEYWVTNVNKGVSSLPISGVATLSGGTGSTSNWTVSGAALLPGTNILAVRSYNYAGLLSPVQNQTFFYQVPTFFALYGSQPGEGVVTGVASVKGDPAPANGAELYVGEGYTLTATAAKNFWLTNWYTNGVYAGTNTALSFIMESNLVVIANFASNLFVGMAGRYDGIFYPTAGVAESNSGLIENLQLKTNGIYTGKLYLAGASYTLSGTFGKAGSARQTVDSGKVTNELNIQWGSSPREITGLVQGPGWTAGVLDLYAATTNENNYPAYTALLPQDTDEPASPPSYSYGLFTNTGSMINMGFALSDGSTFSRSEPINEQNGFPVYANLYANGGLVLGQLSLTSGVPGGSFVWIKPAKTGLYPKGFDTSLTLYGSEWSSKTALSGLIPGDEQLVFSGGGLSSNLTNVVEFTSSNTLKWVSGAGFTGGTIKTNGQMTLTFTNAIKTKFTASGTLLQSSGQGGGFFLGATNAGTVQITPLVVGSVE